MTLEELNLLEAFLEPEDMDAFVQRAMFRDSEFRVKKIGGNANDPKFTYHVLNIKGPNWWGWVRITVVGEEWRKRASHWYTVNIFVRREDGPMFTTRNERSEMVMDIGKDFLYGKIKEIPTPESLYPYIEAALDEEEPRWAQFYANSDEEIDKIAYSISMSIIHYLKGAKILREAIDPNEFMEPVLAQGGFRPLRWTLFKSHVARGNENWGQDQWSMAVGSFDDKIYGSIRFSIDYDSPDDAKFGDGLCHCSASFGLSTGSLKTHRHNKAAYKMDVRKHEREGGANPMIWIAPSHNEAWLETTFRAKPEWVPEIKKCFELVVTKYWRPLLDQRDENGQPMLKQNEEALRKEFLEVFNHQNEIGEALEMSPEEYEQFGEVATDIQYASPWRRADGGINSRFVSVWACDINCPLDQPSGKGITGYIASFRGSEEPWLLNLSVTDGYSKGKYIVGYFKTEPTIRVLDIVRDAALQQIKAYLAGEDHPGNGVNIAKQFASNIQAHIKNDPEVLAINAVNESQEIDIGGFVDDFMAWEGIGEWEPMRSVAANKVTIDESSAMWFKFRGLSGMVTFCSARIDEMGITQVITLDMTDNNSLESFKTMHHSHTYSGGPVKFQVPPDHFGKAKDALRQFVHDYLKPISEKPVVLPNYKSAINRKFLNVMSPWFVQNESIDPGELGDELTAHGGAPLEWKKFDGYPQEAYKLIGQTLDGTHKFLMAVAKVPELGRYTWNVNLYVLAKTEDGDGEYWEEIMKANSLTRLRTPSQMAQFQQRTIDLVKLLIKTFHGENYLMNDHTVSAADLKVTGISQQNWIKQQFDMATNWTGLKEGLDPDEFIKGFDIEGVMRPWVTNDYRQTATMHPHIHHRVTIEGRNREFPFNDRVELNVDYFLSHDTASGMPSEPYVLITGSYFHRGWKSTKMRPIQIWYGTDEKALPIVDALCRRLLVKKIGSGTSTPGMMPYFRNLLAKQLEMTGRVEESKIEGHAGVEVIGGAKYWLDRDGVFHYFNDHEDIKATFPPGWEIGYSNNELEYDAAWTEARKRGYVRVTTWRNITFNPPATDLQIAALKQAAMEKNWPLISDAGSRIGTRVLWEPTFESMPGLQFRSECRGAHNGQSDMTLYAEIDGVAVGRIEYCVFNDQPYVQYIFTSPEYRRKGIGTAMAKQLQKEYPGVEIEWSGSTDSGTPFIASLDREFDPTPNYDVMKKAYDDAKAERDAIQAEFDAVDFTAANLTPEQKRAFLMKGERMNDIETFLWDMEDRLRDLKPGRWMIRESVDPEDFYAGFEKDNSVQGWVGPDMDTSTSVGAYLFVNKTGILGPFNFSAYIRPSERNNVQLDASFQVSCWAHSVGNSQTIGSSECPDLWLRLSPTIGQPSFQPSNIAGFMSDFKQAAQDFAKEGCSLPDAIQVSRVMFTSIYKRLKKQGWKMDVDKHGSHWNLGEALDWTPDEIGDMAVKATTCTVDWQSMPYRSPTTDDVGMDWIMHISAPYGHLSENHNYIRVRFYAPEDDGYIRAGLEAHLASPVVDFDGNGKSYVSFYDHINFSRYFLILPGDEENLRKAIEAEFQRTVGAAVNKTRPDQFRLRDVEQRMKVGFTKLQKRFNVPGVDWLRL
ncbi:MAG: GNAT family N-acetyltransferase [Azonexus sp.]